MIGGLLMRRIKIVSMVLALLILSSIQTLANIDTLNSKIGKLEKQISWALILKKVGLSEDDSAYLFTVCMNNVKEIEKFKNEEIKILENMKEAIYNDDYGKIEELGKEFYRVETNILKEQIELFRKFEDVIDKAKMEKLQAFLEEKNLSKYLEKIPLGDIIESFNKLLVFVPENVKEKTDEWFKEVEKLYNSVSAHILFSLIVNEDFIEALRIVGKVNLENYNQ